MKRIVVTIDIDEAKAKNLAATKLNSLVDIPFINESVEQMGIESVLNLDKLGIDNVVSNGIAYIEKTIETLIGGECMTTKTVSSVI